MKAWCKLEWFPCWIGITAFTIFAILATFDVTWNPSFGVWDNNPFHTFDDISNIGLPFLLLFLFLSCWLSLRFSGHSDWKAFPYGFSIILLMAFLAKMLSYQASIHSMGNSLWALCFGLLLSNTLFFRSIPAWLKVAQQTELYIGTSLVLLVIDFHSLAQLGPLSFVVSWIDTPLLTIGMIYFGIRYLNLDIITSIIMTCTTTICGSSAALAMCGALNVSSKMANLPIIISSCLSIPQIVIFPYLLQGIKISNYAGGAWIGGSIDSTGTVIATAHLTRNDDVLKASAIVKMTQNILIAPFSVAAVVLRDRYATYFTEENSSPLNSNDNSIKESSSKCSILWERFPKFVLGFAAVSIIFNVLPENQQTRVQEGTFTLSEWFSTLSFVSIGLSVRFLDFSRSIGRLMLYYVIIQVLDLILTGILAYAAFHSF